MGCFSSKPEPIALKPPVQQITQHPIANPPIFTQPTHQQAILSVPRPTVTYGDRERNELKVKNLRDKLETTIMTSEQILQDEARLAVRLHRDGKKASARILLRRRQLTHKKIANCQKMLFTVMQMIDSMDLARDNAKFVESVEAGTKAINDIMKDMSVETVHQVLDDARLADQYTKDISTAMEGEHVSMDDEEFERVVAEMTDRYRVQEPQPPAAAVKSEQLPPSSATTTHPLAAKEIPISAPNTDSLEEKIPKPPTELPLAPTTAVPADEEADERVAVPL